MVADGVLLTTYAGSTIDFKNGETVVAHIQRDYYNKTVATLHCDAGAFGLMYEYIVSYLGWSEPSMPSVVVIPSLPQSISGGGRTLYLRKGDGSNWTEADVQNLEIKVGNDTCDVAPNGSGYDYTLNGTVYCTITGSLVTGQKIPILCHGTSEGQPLNYTITSMEIERPVPIVVPILPIAIESDSVASEVAMSNVAESVADVTSCMVYITDRLGSETTNYELVGKNDGDGLGSGYELGLALHESDGAIAFSVMLRYAGASDITKIVITSISEGTVTFD